MAWEVEAGGDVALGLVGLTQMLPMLLFTLPAGHVADNYDRKRIIVLMNSVAACASLGLTLISALGAPVFWIYFCLFAAGTARTFLWPASAAFLQRTQMEFLEETYRRFKAIKPEGIVYQNLPAARPFASHLDIRQALLILFVLGALELTPVTRLHEHVAENLFGRPGGPGDGRRSHGDCGDLLPAPHPGRAPGRWRQCPRRHPQ